MQLVREILDDIEEQISEENEKKEKRKRLDALDGIILSGGTLNPTHQPTKKSKLDVRTTKNMDGSSTNSSTSGLFNLICDYMYFI
jgi:hypothetical protein